MLRAKVGCAALAFFFVPAIREKKKWFSVSLLSLRLKVPKPEVCRQLVVFLNHRGRSSSVRRVDEQ